MSVALEHAALRRVATLVARQVTPAEVFAAVAEEVATVLEVPLVSLVRCEHLVATQVGAWGDRNPFPVGTSWELDEHGVSGRVARSGQPARVDYADVPGGIATRLASEAGIRHALGVPITVEGGLWGVVIALSAGETPLPEGTEDRLAGFTELIATAIANTQARDELRQLADEQSALRRVATLVARGAAAREVFDAVCEETGRLIDATNVNLAHFTADGINVTMAGWSLRETHVPTGTRLPLDGHAINTRVRSTRAPGRVDSYEGVSGKLAARLRELGIKSEVGAPVVVDGQVWGALIAGTDRPEPLPPGAELRVASFAELIATAVSNATVRSELISSRARIVTTADGARRRLARDLHDGAQQLLVSAVMSLQLADQRLDDDPASGRALLRDGLDRSQEGLQALRELAAGVHPSILTNRGLRAAVDALVQRSAIAVDADVPDGRYPPHLEAAAYFVIAEALTNVTKHAQASRASVRVAEWDGALTIDVDDDGRGGADPTGGGIQGLRDRVEALGGGLRIESASGQGTHLHATLSLSPPS